MKCIFLPKVAALSARFFLPLCLFFLLVGCEGMLGMERRPTGPGGAWQWERTSRPGPSAEQMRQEEDEMYALRGRAKSVCGMEASDKNLKGKAYQSSVEACMSVLANDPESIKEAEARQSDKDRGKWLRFSAEARQLAKKEAHKPNGWINGVWANNCANKGKLYAYKLVGKRRVLDAFAIFAKIEPKYDTDRFHVSSIKYPKEATWSGDAFIFKWIDSTKLYRKLSNRHFQLYASEYKGKRTVFRTPADFYKCD